MSVYSDHLFPRIYDFLMSIGELDTRRAQHLQKVRGDILEVGIGTGRNLPYYPAGVNSLTGLDNNAGMLKQLEKSVDCQSVDLRPVHGSTESMPFRDNSFDTIVSTHSLCSMADRSGALSEIKRVLRPGGRFLFLEHGVSPEPNVARWQRRLNVLQSRLAVGCVLDMEVERELTGAGFSFLEFTEGYQPNERKILGYLYEGIAEVSDG